MIENRYLKFDEYGLRNFVRHLIVLEKWEELEEVLCDLFFIELRCASKMAYELLEEYEPVLAHFGKDRNEIEYGKEIATDRTFGKALGDNGDLRSRIRNLRAFFSFVKQETDNLYEFAAVKGYCFQQAYNFAKYPVVKERARKAIDTFSEKQILHHRVFPSDLFVAHDTMKKMIAVHPYDPFHFIEGVLISGDGKMVVAADMEGTLYCWDIDSGKLIKKIQTFGEISSMKLDPVKNNLILMKADTNLGIWNIESDKCQGMIEEKNAEFYCFDIMENRGRIVAGCDDGMIRMWEIATLECCIEYPGHMLAVSTTSDGEIAVLLMENDDIRLVNLNTGLSIAKFDRGGQEVSDIKIAHDGTFFALANSDKNLYIWDTRSEKCIKKLEGHHGKIIDFRITPDDKLAISVDNNKMVLTWDIESGACLTKFSVPSITIDGLDITPDGNTAITLGNDNLIRVWDIKKLSDTNYPSLRSGEREKLHVGGSSKSKYVFTGTESGKVGIWNLASGYPVWEAIAECGHVNYIAMNLDGTKAVSKSDENIVAVWDVQSKSICSKTKIEDLGIEKRLFISSDASYGFAEDSKNSIGIYSLETGKCQKAIDGKSGIFKVNRDNLAASVSEDGIIRIWNIQERECVCEFEGENGLVKTMNSKYAGIKLVFLLSGEFQIWDLASGACMNIIKGHAGLVNDVWFTSDEKVAIAYSDDMSIRIWSLINNQCLAIYQAKNPITSISPITDSGFFSYGTEDGGLVFLQLTNFDILA